MIKQMKKKQMKILDLEVDEKEKEGIVEALNGAEGCVFEMKDKLEMRREEVLIVGVEKERKKGESTIKELGQRMEEEGAVVMESSVGGVDGIKDNRSDIGKVREERLEKEDEKVEELNGKLREVEDGGFMLQLKLREKRG
jgi:hypothetical protein